MSHVYERTRNAKAAGCALSAGLMIMGAIVILYPVMSMKAVGLVIGLISILFGISRLMGYFSGDIFRLAYQYDLAIGIVLILLGTALVYDPMRLCEVMCGITGIVVIMDAVFKLQIALEAKRFGLTKWWMILASACAAGVVGLMAILFPVKGITILGAALLAEGVLHLVTMLTSVKTFGRDKVIIIEEETR